MCHDNTCRTIGYGFGKDFARMDEAAGECANSYDTLGDQPISAVEREANEVFLLLPGQGF